MYENIKRNAQEQWLRTSSFQKKVLWQNLWGRKPLYCKKTVNILQMITTTGIITEDQAEGETQITPSCLRDMDIFLRHFKWFVFSKYEQLKFVLEVVIIPSGLLSWIAFKSTSYCSHYVKMIAIRRYLAYYIWKYLMNMIYDPKKWKITWECIVLHLNKWKQFHYCFHIFKCTLSEYCCNMQWTDLYSIVTCFALPHLFKTL